MAFPSDTSENRKGYDSQMLTDSHETSQNVLSVKQRDAIELFIRHYSDRRVAETVGVTRETVNIWRNHDERFKAALEDARRKLWGRPNRKRSRSAWTACWPRPCLAWRASRPGLS